MKTVQTYQDAFSRNQAGKGQVDNIQANWSLMDDGKVTVDVIVAGVAFTAEIPFSDLCKGFRPRLGSMVLSQKDALGAAIKKGTGNRSSGTLLKIVPVADDKKVANAKK